jgi:hypothetical protein
LKTRSSELFIASEPDQIEDLRWRVKLVDSQKLYDAKELAALLQRITSSSENPLTQTERQELSSLATSEKFEIDEFDMAVLFTINILSSERGVPDYVAIKTDTFLNFKFKEYGGTIEEFVEEAGIKELLVNRKAILKGFPKMLLEIDGPRIRACLAFKEIAALFDPDLLIPHLVKISPKYLASPLTQRWIKKQQYYSRFNESAYEAEVATKKLKNLNRAILGDKRQIKKRERPYWQVAFMYDDLIGYIEGFRRHKSECKLDQQFFDIYIEQREIPSRFKDLILSSFPSPSEVAIEIMIGKGIIKSEKTFREIQSKINKIQKRHFNGNMLQIASDLRPIVFDFIDLPGTNPEFIGRFDLLKTVENIEIPMT